MNSAAEAFLISLSASILIACLGYIYQSREWKYRSRVQFIEKEVEIARCTVDSLSKRLDRRLHAQRLYLQRVLSGKISPEGAQEYSEELSRWMGAYSSTISQIFYSFGWSSAYEFEKTVQERLQANSSSITLVRRHGRTGLSTRDRKSFDGASEDLSRVQSDIARYLRNLDNRIAALDLERVPNKENMRGDLTHVSYTYLAQRLFNRSATNRIPYW